jgi:hypothetical protein
MSMFRNKLFNLSLMAVLFGISLMVAVPVWAQDGGGGGQEGVIIISQSAALLFFVGVAIVMSAMFAALVYFARQAGIAVSPAMVSVFADKLKDLADKSVENAKTEAEKTVQPWDDLGATIADTLVKALTPLFDQVIGAAGSTEPPTTQVIGGHDDDPGATKPVTIIQEEDAIPAQEFRFGNWTDEAPK